MIRDNFLDLVVSGPDMSGTGTQINDIIDFLEAQKLRTRDLRGTEIDALFHSEQFQKEIKNMGRTKDYLNLKEFLTDSKRFIDAGVSYLTPKDFFFRVQELLSGGGTNQDLKIASMINNEITTYINPNSADAWIMEEPTKRGAGQVNRTIEQNRSKFGDEFNPIAAALSHQTYRTDEFLRFRKPLREKNKIIVRSRSEESACYQIHDPNFLKEGIKMNDYLKLPGHKIAFQNAPTNIFVVCGPQNWTADDYTELKSQRSDGRNIDDHEKMADYQAMVNNRYASDWIDNLYEIGCKMHGGTPPEITRFNIYDSKKEIRNKMISKLEKIL